MTDDVIAAVTRLEARQDEESFLAAKSLLEERLAVEESPVLLHWYGYIHEVRGRVAIREAIGWYERAIEADPAYEKAHHQLIAAYAGLRQTHDAVDLYKRRLAEMPGEPAAYRLLASAYLSGGEYEDAGAVVEAGLELAPDDAMLLEQRGSVLAGTGRHDDALATWLAAFERYEDSSISPRFSRVFLLQRLGRLAEAEREWEAIIGWLHDRGFDMDAEWPERELQQLRSRMR
jgi:tetratricopeptide (TPR) repeat protein